MPNHRPAASRAGRPDPQHRLSRMRTPYYVPPGITRTVLRELEADAPEWELMAYTPPPRPCRQYVPATLPEPNPVADALPHWFSFPPCPKPPEESCPSRP